MSDIIFQSILLPALISFIVAGVTIYIKTLASRKVHKENTLSDHVLAEKKKIKEAISKHKTPVLNAFEELNHRLWNLGKNHKEQWHTLNRENLSEDNYYFNSSIYRLASAVCWAEKVQRDMIYLDTTMSEKNDLDYLKFCKFINIFLCQSSIYENLNYNHSKPTDHFFRHILTKEANCLLNSQGSIITYAEFEDKVSKNLTNMQGINQFIDSVCPSEIRLRWPKLFCLHLLLICFLNTYGYDFQHSTAEQSKEIIAFVNLHKDGEEILKQFVLSLEKHKLNTNAEISKLINLIQS